jgi:hypothetical protein
MGAVECGCAPDCWCRRRFVPFSLGQVHIAEGAPDVWDRSGQDAGILALQAGVVVRDRYQDRFPGLHRALFAARHDDGRHLEDRDVVRDVLIAGGIDADDVFASIDDGSALKQVRNEHKSVAESHHVWGVPTFIAGNRAVFVRLTVWNGRAATPTSRSIPSAARWICSRIARHSTSSSTPRSPCSTADGARGILATTARTNR